MRLCERAIWPTAVQEDLVAYKQAANSKALAPEFPMQPRKSETQVDRKLTQESASHELVAHLEQAFCAATGVESKELAVRLVAQLESLQIGEPDVAKRITLAIQALSEIKPAGVLGALLAVEMLATHEAAIMFLRNAAAHGESSIARDADVLRSTKLMRLFLDQLHTMQKLTTKGLEEKKLFTAVTQVHKGGPASEAPVFARETCREATV